MSSLTLPHTVDRPHNPWAIAVAGAIALAVAMGIGRFAFTPLLPMMLADGTVDLQGASWLASANYIGYLVGALLCTFQPWLWARLPALPAVEATAMIRGGLVATVLLTGAMALPWPALWPALRFAAGVASALVFVYTSGWCLAQLARQGQAALGGAIYTGPGAGIVVSGLAASAMVAWHGHAATGWAVFGALALLLVAGIWRVFSGRVGAAAAAATGDAGTRHGAVEVGGLAFAYGLAGFGYIITATFLPVIARGALPGSPWLDFFWPLFGAGVVAGALLSTRLHLRSDLRLALAFCYVVQALGVAASIWWPTLAGFAFGSLLLGLPFTAITFFAMQEVRRVRPAAVAPTMGLLTALYGLGQIVGPPLAAALVKRSANAAAGFTLSLEIAAGTLACGAVLFGLLMRVYPRR